MKRDFHTHTCDECDQRFECSFDLEQNYDGWPEVICTQYHLAGNRRCEECNDRFERERRENFIMHGPYGED